MQEHPIPSLSCTLSCCMYVVGSMWSRVGVGAQLWAQPLAVDSILTTSVFYSYITPQFPGYHSNLPLILETKLWVLEGFL